MRNLPSSFTRAQEEYFLKADERKFLWMTRNPHFSATERDLLRTLNRLQPRQLLEVGCGEAGNLVNLEHRPAKTLGVDLHEHRCRFARERCPETAFLCGDANALPVRSDRFDVVFCRDLLHHVLDKRQVIREMARACRPGGHVVCIEACGRNPVIFCLAMGVKAERGLLRSSAKALKAMLEDAGLADVQVEMHQPLPTYRILLHPRYGRPAWGERAWYRRWSDRFDRLFGRLIPQRWWAYTCVWGRKPLR